MLVFVPICYFQLFRDVCVILEISVAVCFRIFYATVLYYKDSNKRLQAYETFGDLCVLKDVPHLNLLKLVLVGGPTGLLEHEASVTE